LEVTFDPKDAAGANGVTGHLRIETDLSESGFSIPWSAFLRTADRAVTRAADQP
jgi:hypothetical protein